MLSTIFILATSVENDQLTFSFQQAVTLDRHGDGDTPRLQCHVLWPRQSRQFTRQCSVVNKRLSAALFTLVYALILDIQPAPTSFAPSGLPSQRRRTQKYWFSNVQSFGDYIDLVRTHAHHRISKVVLPDFSSQNTRDIFGYMWSSANTT